MVRLGKGVAGDAVAFEAGVSRDDNGRVEDLRAVGLGDDLGLEGTGRRDGLSEGLNEGEFGFVGAIGGIAGFVGNALDAEALFFGDGFDQAGSVFLAERNGLADATFLEGLHEVLAQGGKSLGNGGLGTRSEVGGNLCCGEQRVEAENDDQGKGRGKEAHEKGMISVVNYMSVCVYAISKPTCFDDGPFIIL